MHQHSTSSIRRRRRRRRHSACWHMARCEGVGRLLWWFALITTTRDIRERIVTIRSKIWAMNICSLGFRDIREWVTLWNNTKCKKFYGVVWSTSLGLPEWCNICMHQHSTSGIRRNIRRRRWRSTRWHMAQCEGVGWLLWWFALMTTFRDIKERNVTIRSEIWTMNIRSLGFQDIKEWVTLWKLILQS